MENLDLIHYKSHNNMEEFGGIHKLRLHKGVGVTWVQTSANHGGGGVLGPANICKNAIKFQLSLKTFPILGQFKGYCQCKPQYHMQTGGGQISRKFANVIYECLQNPSCCCEIYNGLI